MDAGFELNTKNPKSEPNIADEKIVTFKLSLRPIIPKHKKTGIDTPVKSPSNPSVKFVAFTVPVIMKIKGCP